MTILALPRRFVLASTSVLLLCSMLVGWYAAAPGDRVVPPAMAQGITCTDRCCEPLCLDIFAHAMRASNGSQLHWDKIAGQNADGVPVRFTATYTKAGGWQHMVIEGTIDTDGNVSYDNPPEYHLSICDLWYPNETLVFDSILTVKKANSKNLIRNDDGQLVPTLGDCFEQTQWWTYLARSIYAGAPGAYPGPNEAPFCLGTFVVRVDTAAADNLFDADSLRTCNGTEFTDLFASVPATLYDSGIDDSVCVGSYPGHTMSIVKTFGKFR